MKTRRPLPLGSYTLFDVDEATGLWLPRFSKRNQIQYGWGQIVQRLLGFGDSSFKINAVYLEYQNVAAPGNPAVIPSFSRGEGTEYYQGLAAGHDYLRVPALSEPLLEVATGYEPYFAAGEGNQLTWFAQSAGTAGQLGRPFGEANNSTVNGIALVAAPVWADPTQDVIFARDYYLVANQVLKTAGRQIGASYRQVFP